MRRVAHGKQSETSAALITPLATLITPLAVLIITLIHTCNSSYNCANAYTANLGNKVRVFLREGGSATLSEEGKIR